ncbi:MAG: LiaI-LiaF-like domain-containing protein [Acidobacteriaceae bacterium]
MNQYLMLRRLRGPLILVTIGVMALLDQYGVLSFWKSWPLILIVIGILQLAERVALSQAPPPPPGGFYPESYGMPVSPISPVTPVLGPSDMDPAGHSQEERKF